MQRLKVLFAGTTKVIDENLASFKTQFSTLRELGTSLFPGTHFFDVEFKEIPPEA